MEGIGDEIAVGVIQLEARRKRDPLAGFGVGLDHLEGRLRDLVAHQNRRIVLSFVGNRDLEIIDRKKGLAIFRLELRGDVCGDRLVHGIGAVRERCAPALGLRPTVHLRVAVFGRGEPVPVGRYGAHDAAGRDLLAGLGGCDRVRRIIDQLELDAGDEHSLDVLRHVACALGVDRYRHLLDETVVAALHGILRHRRVVSRDGFDAVVVRLHLHEMRFGRVASAVVEVVTARRLCLGHKDGAERDDRRRPVGCVVERIAGHLRIAVQVGLALIVGRKDPGALGRARCASLVDRGVDSLVVLDGELSTAESGIALGLGLFSGGIRLGHDDVDGVRLRRVLNTSGRNGGGLVGLDRHHVGGLVDGKPGCGLRLLEPVVAGLHLVDPAAAGVVKSYHRYRLRAGLVRIDRVLSRKGIRVVAAAHGIVARLLLKLDAAVGRVAERDDHLREASRVELERLEGPLDLAHARVHEASRGVAVDHRAAVVEAEHVLPAPQAKRLGTPVHGLVAARAVRV